MYIIIYKKSETTKGIKVNRLTTNAEDIIITTDNNMLRVYNKDDYINRIQNYYPTDLSLSYDIAPEDNDIAYLKKITRALVFAGLTENVDFKVVSDLNWMSESFNVRVTMPHHIIFKSQTYLGLIGHVQELVNIGRAAYNVESGIVVMYFVDLLPEHMALLEADPNVLIENK